MYFLGERGVMHGIGNPSHEHGAAQSPSLADQRRVADMRHVALKKGPIFTFAGSTGNTLEVKKRIGRCAVFAGLRASSPLSRLSLRPAARWRSTGVPTVCVPTVLPRVLPTHLQSLYYPITHPLPTLTPRLLIHRTHVLVLGHPHSIQGFPG